MAEFNLDKFREQLKWGARQYLFYCKIDHSAVSMKNNIYLVRSTSLPNTEIEQIEVPWQGNQLKLASTETVPDFTVTFNTDEAARVRREFLDWQRSIHNIESNVHGAPDDYMGTIELQLLGQTGGSIMTYTLHYAWPKTVGEVDLDYSSKDIAQFDVTLAYQYHTYE